MRYLLLLIGSCIPLTALTAESLQSWVMVPPGASAGQWPVTDETAVLRTEEDARRALESLDKAEVSAAQGLSSESLGPFSAAWSQWRMTREFVGRWLEVLATSGDDRQASRASSALKDRYAAAPPLGGRRLLGMLDDHFERVNAESRRSARQAEAEAGLARARDAFAAGRFAACASQCDELLSKYADAFPPDDRQRLGLLGQRARFRADSQQLDDELTGTRDRDAKVRLLKEYLGRHAGRADATPSEQATLEKYERELRTLQASR